MTAVLPDQRHFAAFHEAGHAVLGYFTYPRARIREVFIAGGPPLSGSPLPDPNGEWRGRAEFSFDVPRNGDPLLAFADMMQTVAGEMAERNAGGCPSGTELQNDQAEFADQTQAAVGSLYLPPSLANYRASSQTLEDAARHLAVQVLIAYPRAVQAIVDALLGAPYRRWRVLSPGYGTGYCHRITGRVAMDLMRSYS